jgi:hypothetical protein
VKFVLFLAGIAIGLHLGWVMKTALPVLKEIFVW